MSSTFDKRLFTLATFAASAQVLFSHLDDLYAAFTRRRISRALSERIMLAVTQVNGCRYGSYAHARLALQVGVSEAELHELLSGDLNHVPAHELVAVLFAQHYAEQADRYDAAAWQRLPEPYGLETANEILAHVRVITFANLYGNTFEALLERLHFQPVAGSRFFDEIVVLFAGATVVPLGLLGGQIARRLGGAALHRRNLRTDHD